MSLPNTTIGIIGFSIILVFFASFIFHDGIFEQINDSYTSVDLAEDRVNEPLNSSLILTNATTFTPELSIPYLGGLLSFIWGIITLITSTIYLIFAYIVAFIALPSYFPVIFAPIFMILGLLLVYGLYKMILGNE